jgi:hypothetical protein
VRFFLPVAILLALGVAGAVPVASVSEEIHDFGTIEEGPDATHIFEIRNTGDDTLNIINVRSS